MRERTCDRPTFPLEGKYHNYEPLIALISEIVKNTQTDFPPTNKSKYYKFYRDYSHDTNDCITLKDEIETHKKGQVSKI